MKFANLFLIAVVSGGLMAAPQDAKTPASMGKEMTMTGCLSKGAGDSYVLTNEKTGKTTAVMGTPDLEKHANHKVKLTGTSSTEGGKKVLNVTKIDHISPTCAVAKK